MTTAWWYIISLTQTFFHIYCTQTVEKWLQLKFQNVFSLKTAFAMMILVVPSMGIQLCHMINTQNTYSLITITNQLGMMEDSKCIYKNGAYVHESVLTSSTYIRTSLSQFFLLIESRKLDCSHRTRLKVRQSSGVHSSYSCARLPLEGVGVGQRPLCAVSLSEPLTN